MGRCGQADPRSALETECSTDVVVNKHPYQHVEWLQSDDWSNCSSETMQEWVFLAGGGSPSGGDSETRVLTSVAPPTLGSSSCQAHACEGGSGECRPLRIVHGQVLFSRGRAWWKRCVSLLIIVNRLSVCPTTTKKPGKCGHCAFRKKRTWVSRYRSRTQLE